MKILYYFIGFCFLAIIIMFAVAKLSVTTSYEPYEHVVIELQSDSTPILNPCVITYETVVLSSEGKEFKVFVKPNPYHKNRDQESTSTQQVLAKWTLFNEDSALKALCEKPLEWTGFFSKLTRDLRWNGYAGIIIDCSSMPLSIMEEKFFNHLLLALRSVNLNSLALYSEDKTHARLQRECDAVLGRHNTFSPTYLKRSDKNYPPNGLFYEDQITHVLNSPDSPKWTLFQKAIGHLPAVEMAPQMTPEELKFAETLGMKKTNKNHLTLGKIFIDRVKKEIHVPVTINLSSGYTEVVLCNPKGRVHESILTTDILPQDLQIALYLLGFKNWQKNEGTQKVLTGSRLDLLIHVEGAKSPVVIDQWIREKESKMPMIDNGYIFVGSAEEGGKNLAERDGNLININSMDKNTILIKELNETDSAQHEAVQEVMPWVLMGEFAEPSNAMEVPPGRSEIAEELQFKGTLIIKEFKR